MDSPGLQIRRVGQGRPRNHWQGDVGFLGFLRERSGFLGLVLILFGFFFPFGVLRIFMAHQHRARSHPEFPEEIKLTQPGVFPLRTKILQGRGNTQSLSCSSLSLCKLGPKIP